MSLYPAILSMGVTDVAERMYQVLRWKRYDNVWRGVHPLRLSRMLEDYGGRIASPWRLRALRALACAYDLLAPPLEALLCWGVPCRAWKPAGEHGASSKKHVVAGYLEWFCTQQVEAVDAGGAGRLTTACRAVARAAAPRRQVLRDAAGFARRQAARLAPGLRAAGHARLVLG
jgi:hypothetical protein